MRLYNKTDLIYKDDLLISKISQEVRRLRELNNLTQEELYLDTNVHIGRLEQGKQNITVSTLKVLCDYFKIPLSEFFRNIGL